MNNRVFVIASLSIPVPPDLYGGTELIIAMVNEGLVERGYRVDMMWLSKSDNETIRGQHRPELTFHR